MSIQNNLGQLSSHMEKLELNQNHTTIQGNSNSHFDSSSSGSTFNTNALLKGIKLKISKFSGDDILSWVFKVEQIYEYHHIKDKERITLSTFALKGDALQWYKRMYLNKQLSTWEKFLEALIACFLTIGL